MNIFSGSVSKKLLSITVLGMITVALSIATVISITNQKNLSSITQSKLLALSGIITEKLINNNLNDINSIKTFSKQGDISQLLGQVTTLGPYYSETSGFDESPIDTPDQIYSLKSQIELTNKISQSFGSHNFSSVEIYYHNLTDQSKDFSPMVAIQGNKVIAHQYQFKHSKKNTASRFNLNEIGQVEDVFDISSVYEFPLHEFIDQLKGTSINANQKNQESSTDRDSISNTGPEIANHQKELIKVENKNGQLMITNEFFLDAPLPDPETWEIKNHPAFLIITKRIISEKELLNYKSLIASDLGIVQEGKIITTTINNSPSEFTNKALTSITNMGEFYMAATSPLSISKNEENINNIGIMAIKPVTEITSLNDQLLSQILYVIIGCTVIVCGIFFFSIRAIIGSPIENLTNGVKTIASGDLKRKLPISSQDEIGQLSIAFNVMASQLESKNEEITIYQKKLEGVVEQQSQELEQAEQVIIEAEKMSSLGELVAAVSHEINTPIGICVTAESYFREETIKLKAKFESGEMSKSDFVSYLNQSIENCDILSGNLTRTAQLVKNFKQVAVDQCVEDEREFHLFQYLDDLIATLKPRIKNTGHKVELEGEKDISIISTPGALSQIITNLIMNAILHAFEDTASGIIKIMISKEDKYFKLVFEDNGKGMTQDTIDKLYDSFYTTKKDKGGTGLGMSIVKNLVEKTLHGNIECESILGSGTRFIISAPLKANNN